MYYSGNDKDFNVFIDKFFRKIFKPASKNYFSNINTLVIHKKHFSKFAQELKNNNISQYCLVDLEKEMEDKDKAYWIERNRDFYKLNNNEIIVKYLVQYEKDSIKEWKKFDNISSNLDKITIRSFSQSVTYSDIGVFNDIEIGSKYAYFIVLKEQAQEAKSIVNVILGQEVHLHTINLNCTTLNINELVWFRIDDTYNKKRQIKHNYSLSTALINHLIYHFVFIDRDGELKFEANFPQYKNSLSKYYIDYPVEKVEKMNDFQMKEVQKVLEERGYNLNGTSDKITPSLYFLTESKIEGNLFKVFFKSRPRKDYFLLKELSESAYLHKILKNEFEDDDSINHIAIYTEEQLKDLLFIHHLRRWKSYPIFGLDIYGVDVGILSLFCKYKDEYIIFPEPDPLNHYYKDNYSFYGKQETDRLGMNKDLIKTAREVIHVLMKKYHFETEIDLSIYLRHRYLIPLHKEMSRLTDFINQHLIGENIIETAMRTKELTVEMKAKKREISDKLMKENKLPVRWKSEKALYDLVKAQYPDTLYQYYPEWLAPQSFDVFVPSLNLAFEYQGIQHYKPIDFFGGEVAYQYRIQLDNKKREKSKLQNTKIIEWHYEEPITLRLLKKKLNEVGINLI